MFASQTNMAPRKNQERNFCGAKTAVFAIKVEGK